MKKHALTIGAIGLLALASSACAQPQTENTASATTQVETMKETKTSIPVIGHKYKVDFGAPYIFSLDFTSDTSMTFIQIDEDGNELLDGIKGTVETTRVEIRPNVYMVYWSEPFNNDTTVTHVQDFENGHVWTNITTPGMPFINLNGPLTKIK